MKVVALVCAAVFADSLLYSAVVPVLPSYAVEHGASPFAVGLLFASYAVTLLVGTPIAAALADRVGRRGPLIVGMAAVTAATLLFATATTYPSLIAARGLQGAAAAVVWTAGVALVADVVPAETVGASLGLVMAAMSAGILLGPPIAGVLADAGGFRAPFIVLAVVTGACAAAQVALPKRPRPRPGRGVLDGLVRDGRFRRTLLAVSAAAAGLSLLEPLLPLDLADRFAASPSLIGLLFGVATLAHLLEAPAVGWLADRRPRGAMMSAGLVALGALLVAVPLPGTAWGVGAVLIGVALAYGLVVVPALPEIAAVVRDRGGGAGAAAFGAFNIAYAVGMAVGPTAAGAAASRLPLTTVLAACGALVAAAGIALHPRRTRPQPQRMESHHVSFTPRASRPAAVDHPGHCRPDPRL